jgi:hypothetical protein
MQNSLPTAAQRPQFTLSALFSCVTVIAAAIASCTQLGAYSIGVLPICIALLLVLASGGTWKEGLLLALYVYAVAACGIAVLLAMTVLAVVIGVSIG